MIARADLLAALRAALEPLPHVHAMWEGGSAAYGRDDAWSDVDLMIDVDDGAVEGAFAAVEAALARLSPIELELRVPEPTWHGHAQRFYRLRDAGPYLLLDLLVMRRSSTARFDEVERHGTPRVVFDKLGIVRAGALDRAALERRLAQRRRELPLKMRMFAPFVEKELLRGNHLAALEFYRGLVLAPLHELVRMRHAPETHDYGMRYARRDLPSDVVERLERLAFAGTPADLRARVAEALAWLAELEPGFDERAART